MALNRVFLYGQVSEYRPRYEKDANGNETGNIDCVYIKLLVVRRPIQIPGITSGLNKNDKVIVRVSDPEQIRMLRSKNFGAGDLIQIYGVFCSVVSRVAKKCSSCGKPIPYDVTQMYVVPTMLRIDPVTERYHEIILLTPYERSQSMEEIANILNERKHFDGRIIQVKEQGKDEHGNYQISVVIKKEMKGEQVLDMLRTSNEISNLVTLQGNVCADPKYNPRENGGRMCSYQIAVKRKFFVTGDDPETDTDYIWIKSLGDQADKDAKSLKKGSVVLVEGFVQARYNFFFEKTCPFCNSTEAIPGATMEVIPYSVEYLRGFDTSNI